MSLPGCLKRDVVYLQVCIAISHEDMFFWLLSSLQNHSDSPESPKVSDMWAHIMYFFLVTLEVQDGSTLCLQTWKLNRI